MNTCPCGSERQYTACCEPYISGKAQAPTAEALMRSRYTAYVKHEIDHVERTHAPETRKDFDRAAAQAWSEQTEWLGLEIKATEAGESSDHEGSVEFIARFRTKIPNQPTQDLEHHELSTFRKDNGQWVYVDGKTVRNPVRRTEPKTGRNDPCPCGSGKKYKKCCAAA